MPMVNSLSKSWHGKAFWTTFGYTLGSQNIKKTMSQVILNKLSKTWLQERKFVKDSRMNLYLKFII